MKYTIICTVMSIIISSSLYATDGAINNLSIQDLDQRFADAKSHDQIRFEWLLERYDLHQIEEYVQDYYGTYFGYYERYLTIRQKEFACKLGLSDIFLQPNLRKYENTKLVFTKNIWKDRLMIRYLAPLRDMSDFELLVSFKPSKTVKLIMKSEINGESSIAAAISRPFGTSVENTRKNSRTSKFLKKITKLKT